jgi:hypothetical protein
MKLFTWPWCDRSRRAQLSFQFQPGFKGGWPGNWCHLLVVTAVAILFAACTSARQDLERTPLDPPIRARLGEAGSPAGPIRIHSGQLVSLPRCCPPLELRDAKGRLVRQLEYTTEAQPIVARAGSYFIVGHNPAGEELVLRLKVVND